MLNNQDFMELRWRNDVGSLTVKDQGISERVESVEDRLINGLKYSYEYFYHDQTDVHLQIVPEIHQEVETPKQDLLVVVPDEHSETGDHHQDMENYSDISDHGCYSRNKQEKRKRRRIQVLSDDESEEFTRVVPSVTRKAYKRRRNEMDDKMRTLQQLVPNCHKTDKVWVLDQTIEYMKNLQLQLQVMSIMGMNSYFPLVPLDFGMHKHNQLLTAMALAHGQNPANQTASSPLFPASNWQSPQFTNLSFPHATASSPQCLYGFVPSFPSFLDFSSDMIGRL